MNQVPYMSDRRRDEVLIDAANRQTPVVLTRRPDPRSGSGWRMAKSRFCGVVEHRQELLIENPADADAAAWPALVAGELLGVAFRRGHKKCLFNAAVAKASLEPTSPCITLQWPGDVQELQRRVYQRECPPPDRQVEVTVHAIDPAGQQHGTCKGIMEDLSAGGVRVRHPHPPAFEPGQAVRVAFSLGSRSGLIEADATFRHQEATADGRWSLGFQFVGLETSPQGQALLARIARTVTDFQRAAIRRRQPRLRSPRRAR